MAATFENGVERQSFREGVESGADESQQRTKKRTGFHGRVKLLHGAQASNQIYRFRPKHKFSLHTSLISADAALEKRMAKLPLMNFNVAMPAPASPAVPMKKAAKGRVPAI